MHIDKEKLKENFLYPTPSYKSMVGKVVVSQKLFPMGRGMGMQVKAFKSDPLVWDGEFEVLVLSDRQSGTTLVLTDPGFPEYFREQLGEIIFDSITVNDPLELSDLLASTVDKNVDYYSTSTLLCSQPFTTTFLSPS